MAESGEAHGVGTEGADVCLDSVRSVLRGLLDRPGFRFSNDELLADLRSVHEILAIADGVYLFLLEQLRTRPGILPGMPSTGLAAIPGRDAKRFLVEALRMRPQAADQDLRAAEALHSPDATLPTMGRLLGEGRISREHVDVAVSAMRRIPSPLKRKLVKDAVIEPDGTTSDATGAELIDLILTEKALTEQPDGVKKTGQDILDRLDPDHADRFNPDAYAQRSCTFSTDFNGNTLVHAALDPATGLQIQGAVARHASRHLPTGTAADEHGNETTLPDRRTGAQKKADALCDLVRAGAVALGIADPTDDPATDEGAADERPATDSPPSPQRPRPLPYGGQWRAGRGVEVSVIATFEQVATALSGTPRQQAAAGRARATLAGNVGTYPGSAIPPWVLAYLTCDNPLRRIITDPHGAVLHHGRTHRLATTAQKRTLAARDGGCTIPGCHAPPEWCDVHHLTPWEHGGSTDLTNLLLLCRTHHTGHHAGMYDIQIRDGIPWVRMPHWADPDQNWLRNTSHDTERIHQLALQLLHTDTDTGTDTGTG